MERSLGRFGDPPRRAALSLTALAGLLILVAVAANAHGTSSSAAGARHPTGLRIVADVVVVLIVLLALWGFVQRLLALLRSRPYLPEDNQGEAVPLAWWERLLLVVFRWAPLVFVGLLALRWTRGDRGSLTGLGGWGGGNPGSLPADGVGSLDWPAIGLTIVVMVGLAVTVAMHRGGLGPIVPRSIRPRPPDLAAVTVVGLQALYDEPDPRAAVIRAYGAMESIMASSGWPRRPSEAPFEYLARALVGLGASAQGVRRLTVLFERARFSQHTITGRFKDEAIEAVRALQTEVSP